MPLYGGLPTASNLEQMLKSGFFIWAAGIEDTFITEPSKRTGRTLDEYEPRINAWYAGMLGWWPPHKRGWRGFAQVLVSLARAVCLTHRAIKEVDDDLVCVHVDPADLYFTKDPGLQEEAKLRQSIVFLARDLVSGHVDRDHPLWPWL